MKYCATCKDTGMVFDTVRTEGGFRMTSRDCPACADQRPAGRELVRIDPRSIAAIRSDGETVGVAFSTMEGGL